MANYIHVGNKVFVDYFDGNKVVNLEGTVVKVLDSGGSRKSHSRKSYLIDIGGKIISRKANRLTIQADRILANKESKKAKNYIESDKVNYCDVSNKFLSNSNKYFERKRKNDLKKLFNKVKDTNDHNFLMKWFSNDAEKEAGFSIDWIYNRIKDNPTMIIDYIYSNLSLILYWANEYEIEVLNKLLYIYLCSNNNNMVLYYIARMEEHKFPFDEKNLKKIETIKVFC